MSIIDSQQEMCSSVRCIKCSNIYLKSQRNVVERDLKEFNKDFNENVIYPFSAFTVKSTSCNEKRLKMYQLSDFDLLRTWKGVKYN